MCIFTRAVEHVSDTNIFARMDGARQYLVYEMRMTSSEDNAMTLPLPVAQGASEDAVRFIALDAYEHFFQDMRAGFPANTRLSRNSAPMRSRKPQLEVQTVGAFEASFVPGLADFERLDTRFRLPTETWTRLGRYQDHGFVVFKLRAGKALHVHPMAFSFPTRDPGQLFFPTVHVHDGKIHGEAEFDHALYYQAENGGRPKFSNVDKSDKLAQQFLRVESTGGAVRGDLPCHRIELRGLHKNLDTHVKL